MLEAAMRVIARSTLTQYVENRRRQKDYRALKGDLDAWYAEADAARWSSMADVKALYATASVLNAERVVFNIKGNDYRLIVAIAFKKQIIFIKWIGTHDEYDRIDAKTVQYEG
jgi:mRNA interferase HigB